ncbi:MAG: antitoxin [Steroidobacteraceae bacterium]|nr:antitoxin [Steroidobacteraceae bacterium]MCW5571888.1 antitoxin [Steroidobacteraceae bacterium]
MRTAKLFRNGDSQAVRLPKEFRLPGTEVWISKSGNAVVLRPKETSWESMRAARSRFTPDFMREREQPAEAEERELL